MTDEIPYSKQQRQKNAHKLHCIQCGAENTIRYPKRWNCHSCGTHWTGFRFWYRTWLSKNGKVPFFSSILLPAAAVLAVIYLIISLLIDDPIRAIKKGVRSHYDQKYGSQSRQKLKEDFGWWYDSKSDARNDYAQHNPNR